MVNGQFSCLYQYTATNYVGIVSLMHANANLSSAFCILCFGT